MHGRCAGPKADPAALAALQSRAYRHAAPWSARDFQDLLDQPSTRLVAHDHAFCMGRVMFDEAEILALATEPTHQRGGHASHALSAFLAEARSAGARAVFLEVAALNAAAIAFYHKHGFSQTGRRKAYYRLPGGGQDDALIMSRALTPSQPVQG